MAYVVKCPHCGIKIETDTQFVGSQIACPYCSDTLTVPVTAVVAGMVLGNYWIVKKIASGELGEVFLAKMTGDADQKVALKVLSPGFVQDPGAVEAFFEQVQRTAGLEHPGLARFIESGEAEGNFYLATEFVAGESLAERLAREKALPEKEALRIVLKAARALGHAWKERGLPHGDIKPSNVMVDTAGNVRVLDLAVYKFMLQPVGATATGAASASLDYISPELGRGDATWDCRADIYSMGATLYHLVTGTKPFYASTATDMISKHLFDPVPEAQGRNPNVSHECSALIQRMMAKDPGARQQGWEELIEELRRLLKAEHAATTTMINVAEALPPEVMAAKKREATISTVRRKGKVNWLPIGIAGCVFGLIALLVIIACLARPKPAPPANTGRQAVPETATDRQALVGKAYDEAVEYAKNNPTDYKGAQRRFYKVYTSGIGTPYRELANTQIKKLKKLVEGGDEADQDARRREQIRRLQEMNKEGGTAAPPPAAPATPPAP